MVRTPACVGPVHLLPAVAARAPLKWICSDGPARADTVRMGNVDVGLVIEAVERVQALPYIWPSTPDASAARSAGCGSCASKHALLSEELNALAVRSRPLFVVGRLVPALFADDPTIAAGTGLLEVHECLTVSMPVGPVLVDVTWDPSLIAAGLPGTAPWDGRSDMVLAVDPIGAGWAPDPSRLREEKEALRARIYRGDDRRVRDATLAAMSARFDGLRTGE